MTALPVREFVCADEGFPIASTAEAARAHAERTGHTILEKKVIYEVFK